MGFRTLAAAVWHQGPGTIALGCCCLLSPFVAKSTVLRSVPLVFLALFLLEPFGFATFADPQLATGMSLRFALPALVFGFVAMLPRLNERTTMAAVVAGLLAVWQTHGVVGIFWNDANARGCLVVSLIGAAVMYAGGPRRRFVVPLTLVAVESYAVLLDDAPARYYDARISRGGRASALFDWMERAKPSKIVVRQFSAGMFSVVSPTSEVANADLQDDCLQAARASAILVSPTPPTASIDVGKADAPTRRCGTIIYEDARAIVVRPARDL